MTNSEIEKRLAVLEAEVASLKSKVEKKDDKSRKTLVETRYRNFADDPIYEEAMRLGREYRESQREDYDNDDEKNDNSRHRLSQFT